MITSVKHRIRTIFVTGLLITLPIAFTFFILNFLFKSLDNSLSPTFTQLLILMGVHIPEGFRLPGLGVIMTVLVIFLVGLFTTNIFGEKLVRLGEAVVARIPIVRSIYTGAKQVVTTVIQTDTGSFSRCVLVQFPRKGVYALGFVTSEAKGEIQDKTTEQVINVFVATTPNPTSGFLIFVPKEDLIELDMPIEDGIKLIISGGIVTPKYDPNKKVRINGVQERKDAKV
ncbi:MAG: DUF502 domain-containing protein [Nitrospinae bacterium]|nr:DUF502 domain-containing protein [Nitrospinota bacterium]